MATVVWRVRCESCGTYYDQGAETRPVICGACGSDEILTGIRHEKSSPSGRLYDDTDTDTTYDIG